MLFISYSRRNIREVGAFADALIGAGVPVWIDRQQIDPLDDFPARIRDGLARSKALLAWYSPEYAESRYGQKELTAAWIAAARSTRDLFSRILVLNPVADVGHIALGDIAQQNYLALPADKAALQDSISTIRRRLDLIPDDLAAVREFHVPETYPRPRPRGSDRFVGRLAELWRLHTALTPVTLSTHESAGPVVQVTGMGGIGKTLFVIEYAERFGAAFPGGVYWLRGPAADSDLDATGSAAALHLQLEDIAADLGIAVAGVAPRALRRLLADRLASSGRPYLWVVHDLPGGLTRASVASWCAPTAHGCTVLTTRSTEYAGLGQSVELGVLDAVSSYTLLTRTRRPESDGERVDAQALAEDLGRHPLAIDVAGHYLLRTRGFAELRAELASSDLDPLGDFVSALRGELPGGHEKSVVATLLHSVRWLNAEGLDLLRLAGELRARTPVPRALAELAAGRVSGREGAAARDQFGRAADQLLAHSLAALPLQGSDRDTLTVHSMVRYSMGRADPLGPQADGRRRALREAAVRVLTELLRDEPGHGGTRRRQLEVAHARHLALQPRSLAEALLCAGIAVVAGEGGDYREAKTLTERALTIVQTQLGDDDADTLALRNDRAFWTAELGDLQQALADWRELLALQQQVLGATHRETLLTRQNIALWTGLAGDQGTALALSRSVADDSAKVLGAFDPDTLNARHNLIHWIGKQGRASDAVVLLEALLHDARRALPADNALLRDAHFNLAFWSGHAGDAAGALGAFGAMLRDEAARYGEHHPYLLDVRHNLAFWTGECGQAAEAVALFVRLQADCEALLGPQHRRTLQVRYQVAAWTAWRGHVEKALPDFAQLMDDQAGSLGEFHPDTLLTVASLAAWLGRSGRVALARERLLAALPALQACFGDGHPHVLATLKNIELLQTTDAERPPLHTYQTLPDADRFSGVGESRIHRRMAADA